MRRAPRLRRRLRNGPGYGYCRPRHNRTRGPMGWPGRAPPAAQGSVARAGWVPMGHAAPMLPRAWVPQAGHAASCWPPAGWCLYWRVEANQEHWPRGPRLAQLLPRVARAALAHRPVFRSPPQPEQLVARQQQPCARAPVRMGQWVQTGLARMPVTAPARVGVAIREVATPPVPRYCPAPRCRHRTAPPLARRWGLWPRSHWSRSTPRLVCRAASPCRSPPRWPSWPGCCRCCAPARHRSRCVWRSGCRC